MRHIKSKYGEAKKQKRNQTIIGIILIIVMFGSVFGIIVGGFGKEGDSKVNYNGFEFSEYNNYWRLKIGDFDFIFKYNPYEVSEIPATLNFLSTYYNNPLYISSNYPEATSEIASNLDQVVLRMQAACLEGEICEGNKPIKTCEDHFIIIEEKNETKIIQDNNCVFIQGPKENLTKISDEFLFQIIGIR